jgi:hypothetical protein
MAETDHKGDTPLVNPKNGGLRPPRLILNAVYARADVMNNLEIGDHTWDRLVATGMPVLKAGTKKHFVVSDDVLAAMKTPESELPPAYESPFAEKNAKRAAAMQAEGESDKGPPATPRRRKKKE